jgi:hypothetical protein
MFSLQIMINYCYMVHSMIDLFLDTNVLHLFCNYNVHKCPVYKTNMMYMHMHPVKAPTINLGEGKWFHCSQKFFFFKHKSGKKKFI